MTGYTTIHAGSARQALTRLRFVCQLSETSNELPMSALNALVSEAVDLVVHLERGPDGVELTDVIAVEDQAGGPDSLRFTATDVFTRPRRGDAVRWTGQFPLRAGHRLEDAGYDLSGLLGDPRLAAGSGGAS